LPPNLSRIAAPELGVMLIGDAAHNVTPQMGQVVVAVAVAFCALRKWQTRL
jgi:2-polyprenyl-6-methoxyphenol hydroxylase-like FAD-dependent oxidoreductase